MSRGLGRRSPALVISCVALFAALGGTVYAASEDQRPDDQGEVAAGQPDEARFGARQQAQGRVDLGQLANLRVDRRRPDRRRASARFPSAVHADTADSAHDAQTALNAVNAIDADQGQRPRRRLPPGNELLRRRLLAELGSETAVTAPTAALSCATQGGTLPDAL